MHTSQKEGAGMNIVSKVFIFFSALFTPLLSHANALSAIAGFGTGLLLIPGLSSVIENYSHLSLLGAAVWLLIIAVVILFVWIGIELDKYTIRATMASISRQLCISIVGNSIVYGLSTIVFLPTVFGILSSTLLTVTFVAVPLIWFILDIAVYGIAIRITASRVSARAFFYRLMIYDLICIGIIYTALWIFLLLPLLQKFRH